MSVDQEYLQDMSSAVNQIIFILNIKFISQLIWFSEQLTNGKKLYIEPIKIRQSSQRQRSDKWMQLYT